MELNRNHHLILGMVILLLGVQFRWVQAYELTPKASQKIATVVNKRITPAGSPAPTAAHFRVVRPPRWLGFAFISAGAVFVLGSLSMQKP